MIIVFQDRCLFHIAVMSATECHSNPCTLSLTMQITYQTIHIVDIPDYTLYIKIKVEVYSLVSSTLAAVLTLHVLVILQDLVHS